MKSVKTARRAAVVFVAVTLCACDGATRFEPLVPDALPRLLSANVAGASGLTLGPIVVRSDGLGARVAAWLSTSIAGRTLDVVTSDALGVAWTPARSLASDVLAFDLITDGAAFVLAWVERGAARGRPRPGPSRLSSGVGSRT